VWAFFEGNDLQDWYRYKEATHDWAKFSRPLNSFRQRSFTRNAVLAVGRLVDAADRRAVYIDVLQPTLGGLFKAPSGNTTPMYFWDGGRYLSEEDLVALEEMRSVFREAHELCRAIGARFLVVFVPAKFRVYKNFMRFDTKVQPLYWVINDLPKRLETIVREESKDGIFLDLTPTFVDAASRGSLVYFADDTHWSPMGHHSAAMAIAELLNNWERAAKR
jgi:hypothetical protein